MKKLLFIPIILLLISCGTSKIEKNVAYQILTESEYKGKKRQTYEVIDNHVDLKMLYKAVEDDYIPQVDFAKSKIIALHLGEQRTGGYGIGVEKISQKGDKVYVKIKKTYPNDMVTMSITSPYTIIKIDTSKKIEFVE